MDWRNKFDSKFNEDTLVSAHNHWTPRAIKDFIEDEVIDSLINEIPDEVENFQYELGKPYKSLKQQLKAKWTNTSQP